ncbi:hypothetical protein BDCR2A_00215 [Borrelia duttonii CR2A]|uniref:Uncharacterized protein n=2 Tax=Borrelia duttonii TaxID=40834 RepID=W6TH19_9SPIR|nr:hypothetical protein [Borrelia duttonii]ACH93147.1 uncharacterized conserved protein [Borrelia duttonii Ly]ETZ18242.1 hypothetical protein BDCR2A_00215 [Borrelia duttonii CR2A]
MLHKINILLITIILISYLSCTKDKITDKDFSYVIIFSNATEYFFKIKNTPFIQENILFINEKDIENIKEKLNDIEKILLTHKLNNEILNTEQIKNKTFYLSEIKFSLKKAINSIFNDPSIDLTTSLIIRDHTINQEDSKYLEKIAQDHNINITTIDDKNISHIKNLITPKITKAIIFSMRNNHIFLKKLSESSLFKQIEFILIGNIKQDIKEVNVKYIISINIPNLIEIIKNINKNFQYEFNIYKTTK